MEWDQHWFSGIILALYRWREEYWTYRSSEEQNSKQTEWTHLNSSLRSETGRELWNWQRIGRKDCKASEFSRVLPRKGRVNNPFGCHNGKSRSGDQQHFLWKPEVDHKVLNKDILKCQECCNLQQNVTWEKAHLDTKADGRWDNWALYHIVYNKAKLYEFDQIGT